VLHEEGEGKWEGKEREFSIQRMHSEASEIAPPSTVPNRTCIEDPVYPNNYDCFTQRYFISLK